MLVGRDRELRVLDEAIDRALNGERAVLVITGEPGIGKSRLLEELATRGAARGATVAWGRTTEVGMTPSFWPWMQILRALGGETPGVGEHADAASRLAMFDQTAGVVAARADARPLVLLFDDVHAADPSSLQLLDFVLPRVVGKRVLVALAAREGDSTPEITAMLARLQRGARRLPLRRLARADVDALVGDRADREHVFALSEGNPLFVEELLASAESEGVLRLPALSSVRAVIRERVARLPARTGKVLAAAALLGRELDGRVVADVIEERDVEGALQPALHTGMLAMTAPDHFKFSHALVAEALADELDPSERARLHLRAAQSLEKHAGDPSEVAHHLLQAGNLAAEAAVAAAQRAAREAMTRFAFEDAAGLLERALGALQLAAPHDRRRRIELACARVEALQQADQVEIAKALLGEIEPLAREEGDPTLIAKLALARGMRWTFGTTDPLLVGALRDALVLLGEEPSLLRARLLARLAAALQPAEDPSVPVGYAREAIAMARDTSPRDRLDVVYTAIAGLIDYVEPDELEPLNAEMLDLARTLGATVIGTHTKLRMCFTAIERQDRGAFSAARVSYEASAATLGPRWIRYAHMLVAVEANLEGRFVDADRAAAEAEALHKGLGDEHAAWMMSIHHAMIAAARGERIGPVDRIADAAGPAYRVIRAWQAAHDGDIEAAKPMLANINPALLADRNVAAAISSAVAIAGDAALARTYYRAMAPRAGQIIVASFVGFCVQDLADRLLLMLAAKANDFTAADMHAARALAIAEQLGSAPWIARVRADWADALIQRDPTRARQLYQEALDAADRMGMRRFAERCRHALGHRPAQPKRSETVRLERAGALWTVTGFDDEVHVRDSKGMQMLARLVAEPGREIHVLDLMGATGADGGDAGELLDATARERYRERLADLVAERDRAEEWGDTGRVERATDEIEALTAELERAVGLGGRERRAGVAAERARSNVQRRVQHAIQQIRAASRRLGEHFAASVTTGTLCVYAP